MASFPQKRSDDDDEALALAIMDGDQAALRRVLELYGGKVSGWLKKHFGDVLQPPELDEAFNQAAFNVWRFADRFDPAKGSLGGWFSESPSERHIVPSQEKSTLRRT